MSTQELTVIDDDDDDAGLTARQIAALERLTELGAEPAETDPETGKSIYSSNPQIRALQLVFQGKFGGSGRGQGRPKSGQRAAEVLAEEIRSAPRIRKMNRAIDRALAKKAGVRANLEAIKLSVDIERGERALQLKEDEHEESSGTREELIATLFEIVGEPATARAIEGEADEIVDATIIDDKNNITERESEAKDSSASRTARDKRNTASVAKTGNNSRSARRNGRKGTAKRSSESEKSVGKTPSRRSSKR
jgi:hypothetical protein